MQFHVCVTPMLTIKSAPKARNTLFFSSCSNALSVHSTAKCHMQFLDTVRLSLVENWSAISEKKSRTIRCSAHLYGISKSIILDCFSKIVCLVYQWCFSLFTDEHCIKPATIGLNPISVAFFVEDS